METQTIVYAVALWLLVIYLRDYYGSTSSNKKVDQPSGHSPKQPAPLIQEEFKNMHQSRRNLDDAELEDEFADVISSSGKNDERTQMDAKDIGQILPPRDLIPEVTVKFCTS
mmetsp:Transcript_49837/g.85697  ORF Transcript_49837/g.85697 Transcript_49837/m.85697 type:complete len:112 (+) Transcript_49837:189-524(+)